MELISYDQQSGALTWRVSRGRARAGSAAGRINSNGYLVVSIDGCTLLGHRIAWLIVFGRWPELVDHRNGERSDNRIDNLREATKVINGQNQRRAQVHNAIGVLGVTRRKAARGKPFQACIRVDGKLKYIGVFDTAEQAGAAYVDAKRRLHEGCTI